MVACPSSHLIISIIVFNTIRTEVSTTDIYNSSSSQSPFVDVKSTQEDVGLQSNVVDIHVAMESTGNPVNLRNIIREEIKSVLRDFSRGLNDAIQENPETKSPIAARFIKCDSEKNNLGAKLDYLNTKFLNIENALRNIQTEKSSNSIDQGTVCLNDEKSLGVHYNSCPKLPKTQKHYPKNCKEVQQNGNNVTGIYEIFPKYAEAPFLVLCDMKTAGGGWTHFQKRFDGSQDFFLGWREYKFGFGNLEGEFWLGLQKIYLLSGFEPTELLVEIVDRDNVSAYARYTSFAIGPEPGGYKLDRLSGYSGDAGDSLTHHLGDKFSTKDFDYTEGCATKFPAGWWFKSCLNCNLNGKYINVDLPAKYAYQGLHWKTFRSYDYSHAKSRMLLRPVN